MFSASFQAIASFWIARLAESNYLYSDTLAVHGTLSVEKSPVLYLFDWLGFEISCGLEYELQAPMCELVYYYANELTFRC